MRHISLSILILLCLSYAAPSTFSTLPQARNMIATIYDDGKSCPNDCDAHVVFHRTHNGTRNAFDPASTRSAPRQCVAGQPCNICFSESASSCMSATYRGGGPAVGRFDFTPAFYEENCSRENLPAVFAAQCRSAQPAINRLRTRINCIANPGHEKCRVLMETVARRKAADDVIYEECKTLGEAEFNRRHRNRPRMQRSNDCAYEKLRRGGGGRWRRLLDGACRSGNYVGRDGLDCCSGSLFASAMLGRECLQFFVTQ